MTNLKLLQLDNGLPAYSLLLPYLVFSYSVGRQFDSNSKQILRSKQTVLYNDIGLSLGIHPHSVSLGIPTIDERELTALEKNTTA